MEEKKENIDTNEEKKDTEKINNDFTEVYKSALLLALLKNDLITKEEYQWCLEQLKK
ncbi:hypothetical protein [Anaerosporobacter sp.]